MFSKFSKYIAIAGLCSALIFSGQAQAQMVSSNGSAGSASEVEIQRVVPVDMRLVTIDMGIFGNDVLATLEIDGQFIQAFRTTSAAPSLHDTLAYLEAEAELVQELYTEPGVHVVLNNLGYNAADDVNEYFKGIEFPEEEFWFYTVVNQRRALEPRKSEREQYLECRSVAISPLGPGPFGPDGHQRMCKTCDIPSGWCDRKLPDLEPSHIDNENEPPYIDPRNIIIPPLAP